MDQPAAKIAMWLLEPAAPGSLTYWGFFNVHVQSTNEFWIRPQYMEVKGREMLANDPELRARFEQKKKDDPKSICPFHQMLLPRVIRDYNNLNLK